MSWLPCCWQSAAPLLCCPGSVCYPQAAQAGASVILQYNRMGGPIKGFDIPLEQALTLKVGASGCSLFQ